MGLLAAAQLLPGLMAAVAALSETAALIRTPTARSAAGQAGGALVLRLGITAACLPLAVLLGPPLMRAVLGVGPDLSRGNTLLAILTIGVVVEALGTYPRVALQWDLRLPAVIAANLAQVLAHFALSVVLLTAGFGLEALCAAVVVAQSVGGLVAWMAFLRRRDRAVSVDSAQQQWRLPVGQYVRLLTSATLGYANMRLDNFLVGATLGPSSMALYSMAWTASRSVAFLLGQTYNSAVLPILAVSAREPERLAQQSATAFRWALWGTTGAAAAVWVTCDPLVPLVLGEQWRPAVVPLRVMLLSLLTAPLISGAQSAIVAEGHAVRVGMATVANAIVVLVAVPSAARAWGLVGAAIADLAAAGTVAAVLAASSAGFRRGLRLLPLRTLAVPLLLAVVGSAASILTPAPGHPWLTVVSRLVVLLATFTFGARLLAPHEWKVITSKLSDRAGVRRRR
jgi:O-antigen/teichoic acid export membrane protein